MDKQEIQRIKEIFGERAKDVIYRSLNFREDKSGKVKCPLHNDHNPSMSWYKDILAYRCFSCEGIIDIYKYYTDFEHKTFAEAIDIVANEIGFTEKKVFESNISKYVLPNIQTNELSTEAIKYMKKRKITEGTLQNWKVKERTWNGKQVYVFQYFWNDVLRFVSYRDIGKGAKGGCETNTEPILWGMWHIDKNKPVVITEGQPDAMVVWQCGYKNVVSVPNGTGLKWIDSCWDWLKEVKEFIYWADNDEPGIKCANEIKKRLENVKIITSKHKDANEVLFYEGAEAVIAIIDNALHTMPEGLLDMSNLKYDGISNYADTIETGFIEYDEHICDWKKQELTIVFGRNGEGKTTFLSQIIAHNLEKKVKTFLYSGEMSDTKIQYWLYRQIIGSKRHYLYNIQTKYGIKPDIKPNIAQAIKKWHQETWYVFDRSCEKIASDINSFFNVMQLAATRYGVKLFIIDNLMAILKEGITLYNDQSNFVQQCKNFAIKYDVHVVLVAHPNKIKEEIFGDIGNLSKVDISGTNNIANKADNIIAIERIWSNERTSDVIVTSLKDREGGDRKAFFYNFSKTTLRFYSEVTKEKYNYSWETPDIEFQELKKEGGIYNPF